MTRLQVSELHIVFSATYIFLKQVKCEFIKKPAQGASNGRYQMALYLSRQEPQ